MADYYTNFSVLLPLPDSDEMQAKLHDWVETHHEMADLLASWSPDDLDEWEAIYDCTFLIDHSSTHVWVYTEDYGSAQAAANLIQLYLDDFEIEGGVLMNTVQYCTKPRVNETGGASVVITRHDQLWISAEEAVRNLAAVAGIEILN